MTAALRLGGAVATAGLLVLAQPIADLGPLAWMALVPLHLACRRATPVIGAALGLLAGGLAALGAYGWMFEVKGFTLVHAGILALYFGLYTAAWGAAVPVFTRATLPGFVAVPALWTLLDGLRGHAGFLAVPWGALAHSQHANLALLQIAALTGERGVTFVVAIGNAVVAEALATRGWRPAIAGATLVGLVHAGGALILAWAPAPGRGIPVAAIQPRILPVERSTEVSLAASVDRLDRLTRAARADGATLIVWPETAVRDPAKNQALERRLRELARDLDAWLVVGASEIVKFAPTEPGAKSRIRSFNAAYLLAPDLPDAAPLGAPYRKRLLVPFGEYVPLEGHVSWPEWLVPGAFDSMPGEGPRVFRAGSDLTLGILICWENLFEGFVRETVAAGATVLVQLTNDAWFGRTAAPFQHNLASVLRAVENRVPVIVASNTGPSVVINAWGRVLARAPVIFADAVVRADITPGPGGAPYTRLGEWPLLAGLGLVVGAAGVQSAARHRATPP